MRSLFALLVVLLSGCIEEALPTNELAEKNLRELIIVTRPGSTTYSASEPTGERGFDFDLAQRFARESGLKSRIVVAMNDEDVHRRLKNGEADMAAAWQIPSDDPALRQSAAYFQSQNILITHEASLPLTAIEQLDNRTVHVVAGSRQELALREIQQRIPSLFIVAEEKLTELDLMQNVANRRFEAALVNNAEFEIGSNYYPELQDALQVGPSRPIVWLFGPHADPEIVDKANGFLARMAASGEMDRLKDRYFGHVTRLTPADSVRFIQDIRFVLPRYRSFFQKAQASTGIDWRLLAALAYQESKWEPLATSATGVRGMMMLTEDTADKLGVSNRLDATQSISAGARYLDSLRDLLPRSVAEPDRTWMALAAYNLGMGHFNAARNIAKTLNTDPDSWYEMKKVLPLLAQARYYKRLKSGRGRGGEAVIMAENVRLYHDILSQYEPAYRPLEQMAQKETGDLHRPLSELTLNGLAPATP